MSRVSLAQLESHLVHQGFLPTIPVSEKFVELFPDGGLRRGSVVAVVEAASIALGVIARATQTGLWCAGVGLPDLNAAAAADLGVVLERFPLIPDPGANWAEVMAALIDGFDLIFVQVNKSLSPSITRKLEARIRKHGTVIIALTNASNPWSQADYLIHETEVAFEGLGKGHGLITGRHSTVVLEGRRMGRPRCINVIVAS